jgi:carbamate kinase
MGPKVTAGLRFVGRTGRTATIGALADAASVFAGTAGTVIVAAPVEASTS